MDTPFVIEQVYDASTPEVWRALTDEKKSDKTKLKLMHTGLASFPNDPHFARHRFEDGWKQIIGSNLKNYLEKTAFKP